MVTISLLIATAIPLAFLYTIFKLDLYKTGAFKYVILSFLFGGLSFVAAYYANPALVRGGVLSFYDTVRFAAPVLEEIFKALILIYLVRRPNFTYFVDGAIYGFAVGMGFAIFENYQYVLTSADAGLNIAIGRVISTNLMHASASALVGIALGIGRFRRSNKQIPIIIGGLLLAMLLHIGFNNLVTRVGNGMMVLLFGAGVGLGAAGFIAYSIKRGLAEEKTWIEEKLGMADRVTSNEAAAVQRLGDIKDLLVPLVARFGEEKGRQIERFLVLQARLGILRKTLDMHQEEASKAATRQQMEELRVEMETIRRAVGSYCMMYLRSIFPEGSSPLWGRLENTIQERIAARPKEGGINLWANLSSRTAAGVPAANQPAPPNPASPVDSLKIPREDDR